MKPAGGRLQCAGLGTRPCVPRGTTASTRPRRRSQSRGGDCLRPTIARQNRLVRAYLEPLAATPELAAVIETNARVTAISRQGVDKVVSHGRGRGRLFGGRIEGRRPSRLARAIVDASGTWTTRNPSGNSCQPRGGRVRRSDRLRHSGYPWSRSSYLYGTKDAGRRVGTLGRQRAARTRSATKDEAGSSFRGRPAASTSREFYSGGDADQLPARGALGANVRELVDRGRESSRRDSPS